MFWLFVALVIFRFGFEGLILVLIASVADLCILFTFVKWSFSIGVSSEIENKMQDT